MLFGSFECGFFSFGSLERIERNDMLKYYCTKVTFSFQEEMGLVVGTSWQIKFSKLPIQGQIGKFIIFYLKLSNNPFLCWEDSGGISSFHFSSLLPTSLCETLPNKRRDPPFSPNLLFSQIIPSKLALEMVFWNR